MLSIKHDVRVKGLSNEILLAIIIAERIYASHQTLLVLTSITDGRHKEGSLHHCGDAVDLRLPDPSKTSAIVSVLKADLGPSYDVVLETDHIHIEFDPK